MKKTKIRSILVCGLLTISLTAGSVGGAFASTALAATSNSAQETTKSDKGLVTGLVALGLLAMLGHGGHSSSQDSSSSAKSTVPQSSTGSSASTSGSVSSGTTSSNSGSSIQTTPSSSNLAAAEQQAFNLLNADRAKSGLPALKFNSKLTSLAESYAKDMINRNYFSHYNPEGQSPFDRMKNAGIGYSYAGENLAINTSPASAETAFMNSPGHRANILNTNYTDVGVGVGYSPNGSLYVVQEFIKP